MWRSRPPRSRRLATDPSLRPPAGGAGRAGHPRRRLRAGARPGSGRDVRRRRRPLRRASVALPPRARGAALRAHRRPTGGPDRRLRAFGRGAVTRSTAAGAPISAPSRSPVAATWPTLEVTDGIEPARRRRLPRAVFKAIRAAEGPVLVQVPRRGYRTSLACQDCRTPARCAACGGPLGSTPPPAPTCDAAGAPRPCPTAGAAPCCGGTRCARPTVGHLRTAEEYARAFPDRTVVTSGGPTVLDDGRSRSHARPGDAGRRTACRRRLRPGRPHGHLADARPRRRARRRGGPPALVQCPGAAPATRRQPSPSATPRLLQALVRADPVGFAAARTCGRAETHLPPIGAPRHDRRPGRRPRRPGQRAPGRRTPRCSARPVEAEAANAARPARAAPRGRRPRRACSRGAAERSAAKLPAVRVRIDPMSF